MLNEVVKTFTVTTAKHHATI